MAVRLTGEVTREDCEEVVPFLEEMAERHGTIRALFDARAAEGIRLEEAVEEMRSDRVGPGEIAKCAVIGDASWEPLAAALERLPFAAEVRRFDGRERLAARQWLED